MKEERIAIVHDQLQEFGGAERVLVALKEIFPQADVYTSYTNWDTLGKHGELLKDWNIITSWANRVPLMRNFHSPLRFMAPYIWESFDLSNYDIVISSSATHMCKGVISRPETLHISYVHHPPRYLYYYETAMEWQKYWPVRVYGHIINHGLRQWDYLSSMRPNILIANSEETRARIKKLYRRDSTVIYPPVSIPRENDKKNESENYYITVSRLARAKHIDILIKAANKAKFTLKIVGKGRDVDYLKSLAGETIEFMESVTDNDLIKQYQGAKAFLFASVDEEFGIAPVEAMGYGLPVIAYASGGLKETVKHGKNGYLYSDLHEDSIIEAIKTYEGLSLEERISMSQSARKESEQYSFEEFKKSMLAVAYA